MLKESQSDIEKIDAEIVDASIKIHRMFGLGFLESAYQRCLERELQKRGIDVQWEILLPIFYEGELIEPGYRVDMLVGRNFIIEKQNR